MADKIDLTTPNVRIIPPPTAGGGVATYWDRALPGFGLRVSSTGMKTFFVQYRDKLGKQAKQTLGRFGVVKAEEARTKAKAILATVQLGGNPQRDLQEKRQGDRVIDIVEAYLKRAERKLKPRSLVEVRRALEKKAKPLHQHKADLVTRREVASLLHAIAENDGAVAADRTRANLSAMWTWALKEGRVEGGNPVAFTNTAAGKVTRDRVLSDAELALIWRCTDTDHDHDRIVRLLMLTAARREEVGAMQWSEVGEAGASGAATWTLPGERTKNGLPHEILIVGLAGEQLPHASGGRGAVFGRGEGQASGFSGWSKCKARLDKRMRATAAKDFVDARGRQPAPGEVEVKPWRLHDLRRTFSTWANESGIEPHVVEAVLNHVSGSARRGVAGVYNKASYRAQKAAALTAWEGHIRQIAGLPMLDDNVRPLRRSPG